MKQYDEHRVTQFTHSKSQVEAERAFEEIERSLTFSKDLSKLMARVAGFASVHDYYQASTVTPSLCDIKIPTFFLSALDDPIYGPNVIPFDHSNDNILLGVTSAGGHICFFQGAVLPSSQWFPEPAFEFFKYFAFLTSDKTHQHE